MFEIIFFRLINQFKTNSNVALSMWFKQEFLDAFTSIILLLIAAWTTQRPNTGD